SCVSSGLQYAGEKEIIGIPDVGQALQLLSSLTWRAFFPVIRQARKPDLRGPEMNLACPNCQRMITIADQFAGQMMQCPLCNGTFTAPMLPSTGAPPAVPLAGSGASKPAGQEVYSVAGARSTSPSGPNPSASPEAKTAAETS